MTYQEYITSIQQAVAANLSVGNIIFGILLLIAIIIGLVFFFMYVRKEYYRKRSEIDSFLMEDQHKTDIFVPGLSDREDKNNQKEKFFEKLYRKLNRDN
ncbi:MAG: hypothetical protein ROM03_03770 [Mucispirillum sp.]|nr:hypothetical protein [Mucispirillum sp.]